MPKNPNSIQLGTLDRPIADVLRLATDAFREVPFLGSGHGYTLTKWSKDKKEGHVVAVRRNMPGEPLPLVQEKPSQFDDVTYSLYADTQKGSVITVLFAVRARTSGVSLGLTFVSNILESLGPHWIIKVVDALIPALGVESGVLCDNDDEEQMSQRLLSGEPLTSIALARATLRDALPPPLLALVRADLCDQETLQHARDGGVAVRLTLKKNVVFSRVDL